MIQYMYVFVDLEDAAMILQSLMSKRNQILCILIEVSCSSNKLTTLDNYEKHGIIKNNWIIFVFCE